MAVRIVTPWGIEWWLYMRMLRRRARRAEAAHQNAAATVAVAPQLSARAEAAIEFLVARGLDENQVRWGSIPPDSLAYLAAVVSDRLPSKRPVRALHIGNFVGVSLCYVSLLLRDRHPDSVVVSIDPNATHRGIENPQRHVLALLHHFDLLSNNVIVPGYTLEQTLGEPGSAEEFDVLSGLACENVLSSLGRVGFAAFDLVMIDGNHDEGYLRREFAALRALLAPRSIVVFDDITEWEGVQGVFRDVLVQESCASLGQNGRVGILEVFLSPGATGSDRAPGSEAPLQSHR
jgi:hypothetical protein